MRVVVFLLFASAMCCSIGGGLCEKDGDCGIHNITMGRCVYDAKFNKRCKCDDFRGGYKCQFQLYSRVAVSVMQLLSLLGFGGVGNLFIGRFVEGTTQLILNLTAYVGMLLLIDIIIICLFIKNKNTSNCVKVTFVVFVTMAGVVNLLLGFAVVCWSIVDGAHILAGFYADSNGCPLY